MSRKENKPATAEDWSDLVYPVKINPDGSVLAQPGPAKTPTHPIHYGNQSSPGESATPFLDAFFAHSRDAH